MTHDIHSSEMERTKLGDSLDGISQPKKELFVLILHDDEVHGGIEEEEDTEFSICMYIPWTWRTRT